jgi:hypothetical protein
MTVKAPPVARFDTPARATATSIALLAVLLQMLAVLLVGMPGSSAALMAMPMCEHGDSSGTAHDGPSTGLPPCCFDCCLAAPAILPAALPEPPQRAFVAVVLAAPAVPVPPPSPHRRPRARSPPASVLA